MKILGLGIRWLLPGQAGRQGGFGVRECYLNRKTDRTSHDILNMVLGLMN